MYVLAMISLKEAMEYGIPFSFIITFATFCDANDALLEKSNWFLCLAWQCTQEPVRLFLQCIIRITECCESDDEGKWSAVFHGFFQGAYGKHIHR